MNIGIEDLRIDIIPDDPYADVHAANGISLTGIEDGWVKNVSVSGSLGQNFGIGVRGGRVTGRGPFDHPSGYFEGSGKSGLMPESLYEAQLRARHLAKSLSLNVRNCHHFAVPPQLS